MLGPVILQLVLVNLQPLCLLVLFLELRVNTLDIIVMILELLIFFKQLII